MIRLVSNICLAAICVATLVASALSDDKAPLAKSTVGVATKIDQIVIEGSEVEAKPLIDRKTPVVVRVIASFKHGTAFRYDLEYYGLEPGTYNLADYLKRKDGTSLEPAPAIPVVVESRLPPGQILPSGAPSTRLPFVGGYRWIAAGLVLLWAGLFVWVLLGGRKRAATQGLTAAANLSPADRLRPLVAAALERQLSPEEMAELERTMHGYWCNKLGEVDSDPARSIESLRRHPEAGKVLKTIEAWLHHPDSISTSEVTEVLAPYRNIRDEETEKPSTMAASAAGAGG